MPPYWTMNTSNEIQGQQKMLRTQGLNFLEHCVQVNTVKT